MTTEMTNEKKENFKLFMTEMGVLKVEYSPLACSYEAVLAHNSGYTYSGKGLVENDFEYTVGLLGDVIYGYDELGVFNLMDYDALKQPFGLYRVTFSLKRVEELKNTDDWYAIPDKLTVEVTIPLCEQFVNACTDYYTALESLVDDRFSKVYGATAPDSHKRTDDDFQRLNQEFIEEQIKLESKFKADFPCYDDLYYWFDWENYSVTLDE